jgi:hypothetical protein
LHVIEAYAEVEGYDGALMLDWRDRLRDDRRQYLNGGPHIPDDGLFAQWDHPSNRDRIRPHAQHQSERASDISTISRPSFWHVGTQSRR